MSEPRPPVGCSPRVRPFPPRPPPEVAFLCSVASSVLRPHPTSHPRTCSACGFWPSRAGPAQRPGMDETSQVPCKERLHVHKVSDCARFFSCEPFAMRRCCLLFSRMRSAPRNSTVSQLNTWPVVSPVNASRRPSRDAVHHSGSGRLARPYPVKDSHLLFFASFPGARRFGS